MLRLHLKLAVLSLVALSAMALAGCSDSLVGAKPDPSFATTQKSYGNTLTPEQQKAAISDLQTEQAKRQAEATGDTVASPQPAQSQN
jgi:carbamate kinase